MKNVRDLVHALLACPCIAESSSSLRDILADFLGRTVTDAEILHFSFNHRNKKRLKCALWFSVKMLFLIFHRKCLNKNQVLDKVQKEMQWNLKMMRSIGSRSEMIALKNCISKYQTNGGVPP